MTSSSSIANILGGERVRTDMETRSRYAIGELTPAEVVTPANAAEVAEIVKHAASERRAIVASGARTKLEMGAPPTKYDIALDMSQMNRIVAYDPGDLTLSVEPGVTLASLAQTLAQHGQMLPLNTPWAEHATIGGTIASGIDAPERQLYGTPRDYLLGAEFVTGDGVLAKSGGRVVKNVTGYDMHKLLIGSFGTLGIITKLNFKTFPLPQNVRGFLAGFESLDGALEMRHAIARSALLPITLEIIGPGAAELLGGTAFKRDEWTIAVGCAGSERVLVRHENELRQVASACGAKTVQTINQSLSATWSQIREFVPTALADSPAAAILKIGVLPTKLAEMWRLMHEVADQIHLASVIRGVGVAYVAVLSDGAPEAAKSDEAKRRIVAFTRGAQAAAAKLGGYVTVPWAPAAWKRELAVWGPPPSDLAEMRKVKAALDPQNILSPGRFVGGI
jgi:glycolate oxidase FAD binding subunit